MTDQNTTQKDTEGILDFIGEVSKQLRTRRSFMGDAAKVGVGAAALSAVGAGTAVGNDDSDSGPNDIDILNYALTLEHLEYAFYDEFLADRKSTRLNSSHIQKSRMPSSA